MPRRHPGVSSPSQVDEEWRESQVYEGLRESQVRLMKGGGKATLGCFHILKVICMRKKTPIMFKVYFYT